MPYAWRTGGWQTRWLFALVVVALAVGLLALTASPLLAWLVIVLGVLGKPGEESLKSRLMTAGLLLCLYAVGEALG